jgi:hypothetical protein
MSAEDLGRVIYSFFLDYLTVQKGLRPASIRSYRDTLRLFLQFAASDTHRKVTRLALQDLTFERVKAFLQYLEGDRRNHIQTRNQRLAALHTFFEYVARKVPEMLSVSEQVAAIPMKRVHSPETTFLEREEIASGAITHRRTLGAAGACALHVSVQYRGSRAGSGGRPNRRPRPGELPTRPAPRQGRQVENVSLMDGDG